ncbi:MAG: hypothetical protein MAG431_02262 [Chloroflexi bacterium]|nr:hypothetical protein [Chloroflexota bacterium]
MKILIISDIHANLTALEAVLEDANDADGVWCLGDITGYGPDPNECIQVVRNLPHLVCLQGNHDKAAIGGIDTSTFNPKAQTAIRWTQKELSSASKAYLEDLPNVTEVEGVTIVHGSPRQPVWEYVMDVYTATINFDYFETENCFVGHTHFPVVFTLAESKNSVRAKILTAGEEVSLSGRAILNPGSVGQPRDEDNRASYGIFDLEKNTWTNHRVSYAIEAVQERMKRAGLPKAHIQRLGLGW